MLEDSNKNYLSLAEAAKGFGVSQNYLRFLIFHKKLRAVKIGRNWVTTEGWLSEQRRSVQPRNGKPLFHRPPMRENYFHAFPPPSLVWNEPKLRPVIPDPAKNTRWRTRIAVQLVGLALIALFSRSNILQNTFAELPSAVSRNAHTEFSLAGVGSLFLETEPPTPRELIASVYSDLLKIFDGIRVPHIALPSFSSFIQWFSGIAPAPVVEVFEKPTPLAPGVFPPSARETPVVTTQPPAPPPPPFNIPQSVIVEHREVVVPADTSRIDEKLELLNQYILTNVSKLFTELTTLSGKVDGKTAFTVFAQSQKIDQLIAPTFVNGAVISSGVLDSRGDFHFDGDGRVMGTFTVDGPLNAGSVSFSTASTTSLSISNLLTVSGTGTSTFAGGLTVGNNIAFTVNRAATANSLYIAENGNVGVGTANPQSKLEILSTGATAAGILRISGPGNDAQRVQITNTTNLKSWHYSIANNTDLNFSETGVADGILYLKAGGNVGVATTSPGALFSVSGNILAQTGTSTFGGLTSPSLFSTTSLNFYTLSNVAPRLTIEDGGNIGIATTGPYATLSIHAAAGATSFAVGSSTATNFVINEKGNVGIGRTNPIDLLDVGDGSRKANVVVQGIDQSDVNIMEGFWVQNFPRGHYMGIGLAEQYSVIQSFSGRQLVLNPLGNPVGVATTSPGGFFAVSAGTTSPAFLLNQTSTGDLITLQDNGSTVFTVKDGGNVGIGTTGPFALLSVNAPAGQTSFAVGSSTATNFVINEKGNVGIGSTSPYATLGVHVSAGVTPFAVGSSTASLFTVTSDGEVRVGNTTNAQAGRIQILSNLGIPHLTLVGPAGSSGDIRFSTSSSDNGAGVLTWLIRASDATTNGGSSLIFQRRFPTGVTNIGITAAGNIGLGDSVSLDTAGNVSAADFTFRGSGELGIATTSPQAQLGIAAATTAPAFLLNQTSTGDLVRLQDNGATVFTVKDGGNVGIGTSSPYTLLDIKSAATGSTTLLHFQTAPPSVANTNIYSAIDWGTTASDPIARIAMVTGADAARGELAFWTRAAGGFAEKMRLSEDGNLGVGTTTRATQELMVDGDIFLQFNEAATTNGVCHANADIDGTSADGAVLVACSGAPNDIAEWYDTQSGVEPGDIVAISQETITYEAPRVDPRRGTFTNIIDTETVSRLKKAESGETLLGVVSRSPYQTFGRAILASSTNPMPIALAGRVPVKVSTEDGALKPGDRIILSSLPGIGAKATTSGTAIGIALESFDGSSATSTAVLTDGTIVRVGTVMVFVNLGYSRLDGALTDADLTQNNAETNGWSVDQSSGKVSVNFFGDLLLHGNNIVDVGAISGMFGKWSIDAEGRIIAKEIKTEKLEIGSPEKPTNVTVYDKKGEQGCLSIEDVAAGTFTLTKGACESIQLTTGDSQPATNGVASFDTVQDGSTTTSDQQPTTNNAPPPIPPPTVQDTATSSPPT